MGEFLKAHLKLEQNEAKTLITHPTDTIPFLGYDLTSAGGRRKGLRLTIPQKAVKEVLCATEHLCKLHHIPEMDLILKVNAIVRGWMNYYRYATGPQRIFSDVCHKVFWQVCHYLAARHRTTIPTILRRYGALGTRNGRTRRTLKTGGRGNEVYLWQFPPKTESLYKIGKGQPEEAKPTLVHEWASGRSLEDRLETLEAANYRCTHCGTTENVEVHHRGGLRGLRMVKQKRMAGQSKQRVALCRTCHKEIGHHGSFAPRNRDTSVA